MPAPFRLPPQHLLRQLLPKPKPSNKTLLGQGQSDGTATPPPASPPQPGQRGCPRPRPLPRAPGAVVMPTLPQELSAGYQLGLGCEHPVISAARLLVPMGLQRRTHPSHLRPAAIGKGQGKGLLRSPLAPANPTAPGAFPPWSSFPVAFWACLFTAFADSAQPCCPPDSPRSLGHGTARGTARPDPARSPAPCQPSGLCRSPPCWRDGAPHRLCWTQKRWQRGPRCPPRPARASMDDRSTLRTTESPKATSCAHGTPPKRPAGPEGGLGGFGVCLRVQGWSPQGVFCSALPGSPFLPVAPPVPAWLPQGPSPAAWGVTGPWQLLLPGPPAWTRRSNAPRPGASSPARS